MATRPLKLRLLLYLYGNANIAGCALALLGPALLLAGFIHDGWLAITAGLYGAGWLLGRPSPALARRIEDDLSTEQTLARLDAVLTDARPHLGDTAAQHLDAIRSAVAEVLPRLGGQDAGQGSELYTVRETVLRYLPETLANYVALPPVFRSSHVLKDGKTARELLGEQLALLDEQLQAVVANVAARDAEALLANGQFLQARFRQADFLAG